MTSLNIDIDESVLDKLASMPEEVNKAAKRAMRLTSNWLRVVTMTELGQELAIDTKQMKTRFKVYQKGMSAKLWIGVDAVAVHRIGHPIQTANGVQVGNRHFDHAFINPMNSDQLLVWRRTGKVRTDIELVSLDFKSEVDEILGSYGSDISRKFKEYFNNEFNFSLS